MLRLSPSQPRHNMTIDDIFSEADDLGLLVVEPLKMHSPAGNLPLSRLEEINAFYVVHGRPPLPDSEEFKETLLAQRLRALRANKQCHGIYDEASYKYKYKVLFNITLFSNNHMILASKYYILKPPIRRIL